jgi:hypothetical protein
MRSIITFVATLFGLTAFLGSGTVAFAGQAPVELKKAAEQCVKGGKALPTAKTKDSCIKGGGAWVKMEAPKMPPDPLGRSKAMPIDPLDKSKAMPPDAFGKSKAMLPTDPLDKSKAMPPAGQMAPAGVR